MLICDREKRLQLSLNEQTGGFVGVEAEGFSAGSLLSEGAVILTDVLSGVSTPISGKLEAKDGAYLLNAVVDGIKATLKITPEDASILVEGDLQNAGKDDRLITITCKFPIQSDNLVWPDDMETTREVVAGEKYTNTTHIAQDQFEQQVSLYPFGGVTNGKGSIAIGYPMDPPGSRAIFFEGTENGGYLCAIYRFVLSEKTSRIAGKASFSMKLYAPSSPQWGFRAMAEDYYALYPAQFVRRVKEGGNWLFQHDYSWMEHLEDYHFRFNETPSSYKFDLEHNVEPFQYTAPGEVWMEWKERPKEPYPTYEEFMDRFAELQKPEHANEIYPDAKTTIGQFAESIAVSAIHIKDHKFRALGWHAYGPTVAFITNHSPELPGWNLYRMQIRRVEEADKWAESEGVRHGGVYIDNMTWGYDNWYNYREEHFQYSPYNLIWDDEKTPVLPVAFTQYEYANAIKKMCRDENRLILANFVFPEKGAVCYAHLVDVLGSEVGPHWGHDLWIQRLRRVLCYQKPWCLLLTNDLPGLEAHDSGASDEEKKKETKYKDKELVMKRSLLYGIFANIIGYRVPFEEYEVCRPLFQKYLPPVILADHLGWHPITKAAFDPSNGTVLTERFGDLKDGLVLYTAMNDGETTYQGKLRMDVGEIPSGLKAWEIVEDQYLPLTVEDGKLVLDLTLDSQQVMGIAIGTEEELAKAKASLPAKR